MAKGKKIAEVEVKVERRAKSVERRKDSADRRKQEVPVAAERRQKVQRRRQIDPTTCEREYSGDEIVFMQAMDAYKRASGRMFPTCSEILEVIRALGYVKVDQPAPTAEVEPTVAEPQLVAAN